MQITRFDKFYICFIFVAAIAPDKSSWATCLLYSDVVKEDPSPKWLRKYQEEDEEEALKRAIKESEILVS